MTKRNSIKQVNPSAAVIIYNYDDRLGTALNTPPQENKSVVDQIIINTSSLISVSTSKSKGEPGGSFQIELAPWKNWVTAITPGSWCVILMGRTPIVTAEINSTNPKVDERHFKMLGRIESVRGVTSVDQATGTLVTRYVVSGTDWGSVFNSLLYVDPTARTNLEKGESSVGMAHRMIYDTLVTTGGTTDKEIPLYDSTTAIQGILSFWGATDPLTSALKSVSDDKLLAKAENAFSLPKELVDYMGFKNKKGDDSLRLADLLKIRAGVLLEYDKYSGIDNIKDEDHSDGLGYIDPSSVFGMHSMWQIMTDNCNAPINELIAEIRWENKVPLLTVYKRVKPFKIRTLDEIMKNNRNTTDAEGAVASRDTLAVLKSDYKDVRRHMLESEDILSVNAGTNWRDRFNFVEVLLGRQIIPRFQKANLFSAALKIDSQFYDHPSIQRDGFTPLTMTINYLPRSTYIEKEYNLNNIYAYKYLGKEWFFDTHKMLNGSITLIGQDNYIQVGDNIIFKANNLSSNFNTNSDTLKHKDLSYITAHVETVSHKVTVSANGARNFITDIQFVRGIVTGVDATRFTDLPEQTLDQNATKINSTQERLDDRVFGTSSGRSGNQDPDIKKNGT